MNHKRLLMDVKEVMSDPIPGIDVTFHTLKDACMVITPAEGPYVGCPLHFEVQIPDRYPAPISVKISQGIDHPNVFGSYICCDILNTGDAPTRFGNYLGGYTPAYTLRAIFLQLFTFFSCSAVEQTYGGMATVGGRSMGRATAIREPFACTRCAGKQGRAAESTYTYPLHTGECQLKRLSEYVWMDMADSFLDDQSNLNLQKAFPPFRRLMKRNHFFVRRDTRCFFLRSSMNESVLGSGSRWTASVGPCPPTLTFSAGMPLSASL